MAKAKDSLAKSKRRSVRLKKCWRSKSDRGGVGATVRRGLSSLFPRNRERSLELEVQQGFTGDRGWLAARGEHHSRASTSAGGRADGGSFTASGNGPNCGANTTADCNFHGVSFLSGSRIPRNRVGGDVNELTAYLQSCQADGQTCHALHPPAFVRIDNRSFHPRASGYDFAT